MVCELPLRLLMAVGLAILAGARPGLCLSLSIPAYESGPGSSVPAAVSLANDGQPIGALQFDLSFDASALSLLAVTGMAARSAGKSLHVAALAPNKVRFLIWELNRNPIPDGIIVNLFVNVAASATVGTYGIHFDGVRASDPNGRPVSVSTFDGTLTLKSSYRTPIVFQGVVNGASLLPGPVAPGELITIMGAAIGSTSSPGGITFNGFPAPTLYAAADQVNAVVPFGIAGLSTTMLSVANPFGTPASLFLSVAPSAPAIFTEGGSGVGQGAVLNQDSTRNSPDNPAERGSIIVFFATGAGQTNPPGTDGSIPATVLPKPLVPVSVHIGGFTAEILYAGAAPGQISGVLQVNCQVPAQVSPGNSIPLLLTAGEATSSPVTVAVR
jgi:uncharacterized protein (TIGR03437 family)